MLQLWTGLHHSKSVGEHDLIRCLRRSPWPVCCRWRPEHGFRSTARYGWDGRRARPRRSVPIEEVARTTCTCRAVAVAAQIRLNTALTGEDYVKRKAWLDATAPPCPWHKQNCELVSHGTYDLQTPEGARVRRFRCRCRQLGRTVSLLPDCLAARLPSTLADVEATVRRAEQVPSLAAAAIEVRPGIIEPRAAERWTSRRLELVQRFLELLHTLYPARFGAVEPTVIAFGAAAVLAHLRAVAAKLVARATASIGTDRCGRAHRSAHGRDCGRPRRSSNPRRTGGGIRAPTATGSRPRSATETAAGTGLNRVPYRFATVQSGSKPRHLTGSMWHTTPVQALEHPWSIVSKYRLTSQSGA